MHLGAILLVAAVATPGEATATAPALTRVGSCTPVVQPAIDDRARHPGRTIRRTPPPHRRSLRRQDLVEQRTRIAGHEIEDLSMAWIARDLTRRSAFLLSAPRPHVERSRMALRLILAGVSGSSLHTPPPSPLG